MNSYRAARRQDEQELMASCYVWLKRFVLWGATLNYVAVLIKLVLKLAFDYEHDENEEISSHQFEFDLSRYTMKTMTNKLIVTILIAIAISVMLFVLQIYAIAKEIFPLLACYCACNVIGSLALLLSEQYTYFTIEAMFTSGYLYYAYLIDANTIRRDEENEARSMDTI